MEKKLPEDYIEGFGQPADEEVMQGTSADRKIKPDDLTCNKTYGDNKENN